ncbi:uncharacterized protein FPOAC1_013006 [Fusarium poae]|uniref:uncharacterized protein n=1 Tax=Fusarium poae TaxID=36050 RepID=UPI001D049A27|nr:uncharacterized protein FPOAC1_013950 [Fusarium poae]XP_044701326.1 uncharacterized protein FPOAC1_013603 [Fusarium poae]XP_044701531.1 uncharacterized protein FPOAC1_013006 [Fusarium poae]KAG8664243.1 hypothetical protein FPOAC1_013950 [Fusarium poae]KAG8664823.1 hypothetical protein FPOAC1_013603 [Fusarium poae]KAG8665028.1 hypothetical protein FPOAC1_013006 [Fusarium poae]
MDASSTISTGNDRNNQGLPSAPATVNAGSIISTQVTPKPTVIGLYGISGSGKSFLLEYLRQKLSPAEFILFEGSDKIASLIPGGLEAFHKLDAQDKSNLRGQAIDAIRKESLDSGRTAIVTGHLMFWKEQDASGQLVYTSNDLATFTHIIYLNMPVGLISQRCLNDEQKHRIVMSHDHLRRWQETEISLYATSVAKLDEILALPKHDDLETVLVMDGDKTLTSEDTGVLFWETLARAQPSLVTGSPLHELFSSRLGYSEAAFHQATLLYEEVADDKQFETVCDAVAAGIVMHPQITSLLRLAAERRHIGTLVVTCGLGHVWRKVLERYKLSETVYVIGGGRIKDGFVVTAAAKAAIVSQLRNAHLYVWAFGDSPLDLPMLKGADQAIVVVGDKQTRSWSMDEALSKAMDDGNFRAQQVLLPSQSTPRLDEGRLPLAHLDDRLFIESVMCHRRSVQILHATDRPVAQLLTTPTRDASISGPALRQAHGLVGQYLATEFVTQLIGLQEYNIPHVQGHQTTGHRLRNEEKTSIVALMRGGEAMAFGVNMVFPQAMFIHASSPPDLKVHHVDQQRTIILVDSVVNSGKTLMQFIEHVHGLQANVRIIVVAGVVQADVVVETHPLADLMRRCGASLAALRLSKNKFVGTKGTDTGNRLFNTTHLA